MAKPNRGLGTNPKMTQAVNKLLEGGGFRNFDDQRNMLLGDAKMAQRDALRRTASAGAGRGLFGAGMTNQDLQSIQRDFSRERQRGTNELINNDEQLHLARVGTGLNAGTTMRGQDVQNLASARSAGASRFATQKQFETATADRALRELLGMSELDLRRMLGQGQLDLGGRELDIRDQLGNRGLNIDQQRADTADFLGRGDLGLRELLGNAGIQDQLFQQYWQNFLMNQGLGQMPGFSSPITSGVPASVFNPGIAGPRNLQ